MICNYLCTYTRIIQYFVVLNIIHTRLRSEFYANGNERDHGLDNGSRPRQRTIIKTPRQEIYGKFHPSSR